MFAIKFCGRSRAGVEISRIVIIWRRRRDRLANADVRIVGDVCVLVWCKEMIAIKRTPSDNNQRNETYLAKRFIRFPSCVTWEKTFRFLVVQCDLCTIIHVMMFWRLSFDIAKLHISNTAHAAHSDTISEWNFYEFWVWGVYHPYFLTALQGGSRVSDWRGIFFFCSHLFCINIGPVQLIASGKLL